MSDQPKKTSRTIVITGATSGIGYACAAAILGSDGGPWHVVLPCRDAGRATAAVDALAGGARTGNTMEAMSMDLASLESVRAFAAELRERLAAGEVPGLQAVVCNAGVQAGTNQTETQDGFESTFGVNHLGHFLLVNELMPVLQPPARVVVVASDTHDPTKKVGVPTPAWNSTSALARGQLGPRAMSDKPFAAGQRRYSTSKLANIYFTYALTRRLPQGVTANAFNPGLVPGTGLQRDAAAPLRFVAAHVMPRMKWVLRRVVTPNVHTLQESGGSLAWLATAPELAGVTGKYFDQRQAIPSSEESYDLTRAETLWNDSVVLTAQPTPTTPR
jgi:NAD(P)-dependent dehydrogenase (short-subunit alcohol dehydrogenase family)